MKEGVDYPRFPIYLPPEIILGPGHFQSSRDGSFFKYQYRTSAASELECQNSEDEAVSSFVVPFGCKATHVDVYGDFTDPFKIIRNDPENDTEDFETTGGAVGTQMVLGAKEIPHKLGQICFLQINMTAGDKLKGAKITLAAI